MDVVVVNPDGQAASLPGAFTFVAAVTSANEDLRSQLGDRDRHCIRPGRIWNAEPLRTLTGLDNPVALAFDRSRDEILVASQRFNGLDSIAAFDRMASGGAVPTRMIAGPSTMLSAPTGLAVDPVHGEIVVANFYANRITVYPILSSGDVAPVRIIEGPSTELAGPFGLHLDLANDEIIVAGWSTISVYRRTASGDEAPLRTVQTGLSWVTGVSVGGDETFVVDRGGSTMAVFERTAAGNAQAIRVVQGSSTGISQPAAVIVDPASDLVFVGNLASHAVTVHGRASSGDSAPLRTIEGAATGLRQPHGFAIRRAGTWTLSLTKVGSGEVTSAPGGISCGAICSAEFASGAVVGLAASPAPGWSFTGWSGSCSGSGACVVTMDAARSATATFALASGGNCSTGSDCASGFCTDGVCCDQACDGQCQACDVAGSVGTCVPVSGQPHGTRAACASDGSACGGSCDGTNDERVCLSRKRDGVRRCVVRGGIATPQAVCGGAGSCTPAPTQSCQPFVCGPSACLTACVSDAQCSCGIQLRGRCVPSVAADRGRESQLGSGLGRDRGHDRGPELPGRGERHRGRSCRHERLGRLGDEHHVHDARRKPWVGGRRGHPRRWTQPHRHGRIPVHRRPAMTSISPTTGPAMGGTIVHVYGSGFVAGATVSFGGAVASVSGVIDEGTIVAMTPPSAGGTVDVVVRNPDGQVASGTGIRVPVHSDLRRCVGKRPLRAVSGAREPDGREGGGTGGSHTVALKNDGTVVAWGNNATVRRRCPPGSPGVTAIAAGTSTPWRSRATARSSPGATTAHGQTDGARRPHRV